MTLADIIFGGGVSVAGILTLIQIAPIQVNPWSWLAKCITSAMNKDVLAKLDQNETKLDSLNEKVVKLDNKVATGNKKIESLEIQVSDIDGKVLVLENKIDEVEENSEERDIILCRVRILRFGDEILHGTKHSKEHFDQILLDCTNYENYCKSHPGFLNNITGQTIDLIKSTYMDCMKNKSFL